MHPQSLSGLTEDGIIGSEDWDLITPSSPSVQREEHLDLEGVAHVQCYGMNGEGWAAQPAAALHNSRIIFGLRNKSLELSRPRILGSGWDGPFVNAFFSSHCTLGCSHFA